MFQVIKLNTELPLWHRISVRFLGRTMSPVLHGTLQIRCYTAATVATKLLARLVYYEYLLATYRQLCTRMLPYRHEILDDLQSLRVQILLLVVHLFQFLAVEKGSNRCQSSRRTHFIRA